MIKELVPQIVSHILLAKDLQEFISICLQNTQILKACYTDVVPHLPIRLVRDIDQNPLFQTLLKQRHFGRFFAELPHAYIQFYDGKEQFWTTEKMQLKIGAADYFDGALIGVECKNVNKPWSLDFSKITHELDCLTYGKKNIDWLTNHCEENQILTYRLREFTQLNFGKVEEFVRYSELYDRKQHLQVLAEVKLKYTKMSYIYICIYVKMCKNEQR